MLELSATTSISNKWDKSLIELKITWFQKYDAQYEVMHPPCNLTLSLSLSFRAFHFPRLFPNFPFTSNDRHRLRAWSFSFQLPVREIHELNNQTAYFIMDWNIKLYSAYSLHPNIFSSKLFAFFNGIPVFSLNLLCSKNIEVFLFCLENKNDSIMG